MAKQVIIVSATTDDLADNREFIEAMGMEDDSYESNSMYYGCGGDCWTCDPDKVKHGGIVQQFYTGLSVTDKDVQYIILNFDPLEFPEHVKLIEKFWKHYETFGGAVFLTCRTNNLFSTTDTIIAYRGGSGYIYGLWCPSN